MVQDQLFPEYQDFSENFELSSHRGTGGFWKTKVEIRFCHLNHAELIVPVLFHTVILCSHSCKRFHYLGIQYYCVFLSSFYPSAVSGFWQGWSALLQFSGADLQGGFPRHSGSLQQEVLASCAVSAAGQSTGALHRYHIPEVEL